MPPIYNPRQTILVTSRAEIDIIGKEVQKDDIITLSWHMPVSFKPSIYAIAIGKSKFSSKLIEKSKDKKVYFIGAYMHMLNPELSEYLINNCTNLAKDLFIKKYNYNSFYRGRYYWPNLFVYNSSSPD